VREAPRPELGGIDESDVKKNQGDIEQTVASAAQPRFAMRRRRGTPEYGEKEGAQEHEVEMEVGKPESGADQGASGWQVAALEARVVGVAQMEQRDRRARSPRWRRLAPAARRKRL